MQQASPHLEEAVVRATEVKGVLRMEAEAPEERALTLSAKSSHFWTCRRLRTVDRSAAHFHLKDLQPCQAGADIQPPCSGDL